MKNLVRYRAMESLCRQSAVFHPMDSWRLLAQAEMWHHKALDEMTSGAEFNANPQIGALARAESRSDARDGSQLRAS